MGYSWRNTSQKYSNCDSYKSQRRSFFNAEIIKYNQLRACTGENRPHVQNVGKCYIEKDNDIIYFWATKGKNYVGNGKLI